MLLPFESLCRAVEPRVPGALISAPAWARIVALAEGLPALFCWAIFECRLQRDADRADVLLCISRWDGDDAGLRDSVLRKDTLDALGRAPRFLRAWLEPGTMVCSEVPLLWLEYDLIAGERRAPFVQFCVDSGYPRPGPRVALSPARLSALADEGLSLLLGERPEPAVLANLQRCAERLPPGARVLHLGAMPQRGTSDLRVLAVVPAESTPAWLEAIGWPGPREGLQQLLALLAGHFPRLSVQLDLGEVVRPTLALEFPLTTRPDRDPRWRQFIDALVDLGLCDPDKGRASLDWIGDETVDLPEADWLVQIQRRLDIKVILGPDGRLEAKAYLCSRPQHVLA